MRLSKIKLAGFKSFVDPVTILFPGNLTGIVGPNGCGKSNVIDAVRWVMGESSAKNLRGDSMADVIFNGSSSRKPVGNASVELVFDNADGAIGGQYANYAEISIRRVVSRDGTSIYYLNNTRCRRKDITAIFLGTGLGPRSYAIIEQGMISRLIEARPDELRVFLEEAAGISKYKERRRETEIRIRRTRENLERLHDLIDEIEKQIKHLQRQSRAAKRYKKLKAQERKLGAELIALKLRSLDEKAAVARKEASDVENRLQAAVSGQRGVEAKIEESRDNHNSQTDIFNEVQARYYKVGAEIARLEQNIQHARELKKRQEADLEQAQANLSDIKSHIEKDESRLHGLAEALDELGPNLEKARRREADSTDALRGAEQELADWQEAWESFGRENHTAQNQVQVHKASIEHLENQLSRMLQQKNKVGQEQQSISNADSEEKLADLVRQEQQAEVQAATLRQRLQQMSARMAQLRTQDQELTGKLDLGRSNVQKICGRLATLEAMQQAALGQTEGEVVEWLEGRNLSNRPRLAQELEVEAEWEPAVETVLGSYLEAVCVEGIDAVAEVLGTLKSGSITFIDRKKAVDSVADQSLLLSKIQNCSGLETLLNGVYIADSLEQALATRENLRPGDSIVTKDGIWLGGDWLRVARGNDEQSGVIHREQQIRMLREQHIEYAACVTRDEGKHVAVRRDLEKLESERETAQEEGGRLQRLHADLSGQLKAERHQAEQTASRTRSLGIEFAEVTRDIEKSSRQLRTSRAAVESGVELLATLEEKRVVLKEQRVELQSNFESCREIAKEGQDACQEIAIKVESRRSSRESASANLSRMEDQLRGFGDRVEELEKQLRGGEKPFVENRQQLSELLKDRITVEKELGEARKRLEEIEEALREQEQERTEAQSAVEEIRQSSDRARMTVREISVRREGVCEQFDETGFGIDEINSEMPDDASVEQWDDLLERLASRINRLGPINLAAIGEYQEQLDRKEYLDKQNSDLSDALQTLENAIRKIDRETRTRFKETFDNINDGLKQKFPRLFGGGHAYLELVGDDLLNSGVTIMAQPPGKRNSTIHLLSGGEKALTAVALVFSIFELNAAPFCLLDEVDAPLDDANVSRFCEILRDMSERVQFVIITHNKTTMEMTAQLTGVTMHEAGVSRLVSVDVDEAVEMAAS
ncbi:MAG: chromosome segregation protein SMC [Gammaproteobacteria bacterium]|nr:chromosome segregation protein SMC [Gammaproteobacteria bacterium]